MGYDPLKAATQVLGEVRKRTGPVLEDASFSLKHVDGTLATVFGDRALASPGENPTLSDESGYPNTFYRHGDYIAEWVWNNDTHQRYIRIPPVFEDFGLVDVTKFDGVDPSGLTDSQAGINAASLECAGSFKLFFPPGIYRADGRLNVYPGSHWVGCGMLTTLFAGDSNTNTLIGHPTISVPPLDDVIIDGFLFDGNGANRPTTALSIVRLGYGGVTGSNVEVRNCFFANAKSQDLNIYMKDLTNPRVVNCTVLDGGKDGFGFGSCFNLRAVGNTVLNCTDDGISMWGCDGGTVAGNIIWRDNEHNIFGRSVVVGDSTRRVTVTANFMSGNTRGNVEINGNTEYIDIVGNVLANAGERDGNTQWGNGIHFQVPGNVDDMAQNYIAEHVNIVGNTILNPREHGVLLEPKTNSVNSRTIHHANISENIIISDGLENAGFKSGLGCGVHASTDDATTNLNYIKITGNIIYGFDQEGILATGVAARPIKGLTIANNEIYNSGRQAINDSYAIYADYVQDLKLKNNTGEDTQTTGGQSQLGIFVDHPSGVAQIIGNDMIRCKGTNKIVLTNFANAPNPTIRDNAGFSPLAGKATASATTWTLVSGSVWKRSLTIPYPDSVGISLAANPKITAVTDQDGWFCTIGSISATTFTVNIFSVIGNPGSQAGIIHWQVEV